MYGINKKYENEISKLEEKIMELTKDIETEVKNRNWRFVKFKIYKIEAIEKVIPLLEDNKILKANEVIEKTDLNTRLIFERILGKLKFVKN